MSAAGDANGGFRDVEVFGEELDEGSISLAIVRFSAKIDSELTMGSFDDFFLRRARFDSNLIFHNYIIQYFGDIIIEYAQVRVSVKIPANGGPTGSD